jgi:hypothetical protein
MDLIGHEGGSSQGEFGFTLDISDIATGWTENVSVRNKAQKWVFGAIREATAKFPFPRIRGGAWAGLPRRAGPPLRRQEGVAARNCRKYVGRKASTRHSRSQ